MLFHLFYFCVWRSPFLLSLLSYSLTIASLSLLLTWCFHCCYWLRYSNENASSEEHCSLWPLEGQCHTAVNLNSGRGKRLEESVWLEYRRSDVDSCLMLSLPWATEKARQLPACCGLQLGSGSVASSLTSLCPSAWAVCFLALAGDLHYCICSTVSNETSCTFLGARNPSCLHAVAKNIQLFFFILSVVLISEHPICRR